MPYYLAHVGTTLQKLSTAGVYAGITLPAGVTIVATRPCRFALLGNYIFIVNAPSVNLSLSAIDLTCRIATIDGPSAALTAAVGAAGALNGDYRYRYSFIIKDGSGVVITESPMSDASDVLSLVNQQGSLSDILTSGTSGVNCRRIYRTLTGGADYYPIHDIDDNTTTTYTDSISDYDAGLLSVVDDLGNPPGHDNTDYFRLCCAWKDRVWAAGNLYKDRVYFSGNNRLYAWSNTQYFDAKVRGEDEFGVSAFMPRRDELVIAKRRRLHKIIGTAKSNFEMIQVAERIGCISQETVVIVRDVAYFLHEDGVYSYGPEGLKPLSREKVDPWFTSDTFFNRARFQYAFAHYNQNYDLYELHLSAAGSTVEDRWVAWDIKKEMWLGPHKTGACTPTCAGVMDDPNGLPVPFIGASNGHIYQKNYSTRSDDGTAIQLSIIGKFHSGAQPDLDHYWGELSVINREEIAGTLSVIPRVGDLDAADQATISVALTRDRTRCRRLGEGRFARLEFQENTNNQDVLIYGYEINPTFPLGRR